jgi:hypothetical protein
VLDSSSWAASSDFFFLRPNFIFSFSAEVSSLEGMGSVVVDLTPFFLRRNGIVDVVDARGIINC